MNPEYEKQLEASVRRELSTLGDLSAPPALANRVLHAIKQRTATPWYRGAWQTWSLPLRGISLLTLLAVFGGICFGFGELTQAASLSAAGQQVARWFTGAGVFCHTASVLADAIATAIRHLGMGYWIAFGLALAAAYAASVGLGTVCVRLGMARR